MTLVRAELVRAHVLKLRAAGGTYHSIGQAARTGAMTVHTIANARRPTVQAAVASRLLAITEADIRDTHSSPGATMWRLRALVAMGHTCTRMAAAIGVPAGTLRRIVRGDALTVSPELRQAVIDLFDAWWDKTPSQRTRQEMLSADGALKRAAVNDWPCPAGLDEDELDRHGYQPQCGWRQACGTGVADDYPFAEKRPCHENPPAWPTAGSRRGARTRREKRSGACTRDLGSCPAKGADPAGRGRAGPGRRARPQADARARAFIGRRQRGRTVTTTDSSITQDLTLVEAAILLEKLEEGHQAAWLSTHKVPWHSAEYQARFQNAAEVDDIFRDLMWETVENGMRRPGEPVEEFAERAESQARLAEARKASAEPPADMISKHAGIIRERLPESQDELAGRLRNDASTPEGRAYARAFSDTAATHVRDLREHDPLPEPDRAPGAPHPDPFLASRGWHVNKHGIYTRRAEPESQAPPEHELEAGS